WSIYAARTREFDEAIVRTWKEEIHTVLVFSYLTHVMPYAGLFSAVVTAFDIEAYQLPQDDLAQATAQLLQEITQQL
ncbi:hypothetical protein BV20DRAFT_918976, partial [Pilatotrama ljubarskyi]